MSAAASLSKVIYYGTEMEILRSQLSVSGKLIKTDPYIEFTWTAAGRNLSRKS